MVGEDNQLQCSSRLQSTLVTLSSIPFPFDVAVEKAFNFVVLCIYFLHKPYSIRISPNICAFSECVPVQPHRSLHALIECSDI